MQTCISQTSQILTPEGYQYPEMLKPGQLVLNMKLEPVKVNMMGECLKSPMIEINYQNWYESLRCSPSQELIVMDVINDQTCEIKWVRADKIEKGMLLMSVEEYYDRLPETFTIFGKGADYSIGLLFGLYAGYGNIDSEQLDFTFGPNDELAAQVKQLCQELNCETFVKKTESVYQVSTKSGELIALFSEFGNKVQRKIPEKYWVKNLEYLRGLFEGLIDYNSEQKVCRYISVSREMCNAFVWITSQQAINFEHDAVQTHQNLKIYPLLVRVEQEQSYLNRVLQVQPISEEKGWYISTDCPTNSIIVNNVVLKSDDD